MPLRAPLTRLGLLASAPAGYTYHGFISYSHAADGKLAPALQRGLQRFAKPWYQARALRVFRDDASMSVNANLWRSIVQALDNSEYYILLGSPDAAASEWVGREVKRWRETKPIDRLLIALTGGELQWDGRRGDFDWERTSALPRALEGAFEDEPRFIDLRWARDETDLSLDQARFAEAVADLAAPLHGRPKDELASEEVLQQRRAVRARRVVAAALVAITLVAVLAGVLALIARHSALRSAAATESQLLASRALGSSDVSQASLTALEAYRLSPTFDARAALVGVAQSHQLGATFAPGAALYDAALSPDGSLLAAGGGDGTLRVWNVTSHRVVWTHTEMPAGGGIGAVAFSRNGRELAYAWNGARPLIRVVEVGSWTLRYSLAGQAAAVNSLAFSPTGGELASGSSDRTVRLWTGQRLLMVLRGHSGPVSSVAFSGDGRLLAASSCDQATHADTGDHDVLVWEARTGALVARLHGSYPVCGAALSPDGRLAAAAGDDGAVAIWDVRTGQPSGLPLIGHTDSLSAVAFSPDGKLIASASVDHTVRIWDLASRREAYAALDTTRTVNAVSFSADGTRLASAGFDGAHVWSTTAPTEAGVLGTGVRDTLSVAIGPDGRYLAWTDDRSANTLHVWDMVRRRKLGSIAAPGGPGYAPLELGELAFAGARTLVWATGGDVRMVTIAPGRLQAIVVPGSAGSGASHVAVSGDGKKLAFDQVQGGVSAIRLWDLAHNRALPPLASGLPGRVGALAFSPNGRFVASGGFDDGSVRVWDLGGGSRGGRLIGRHSGSVYALAFSPDDRILASAGADETVRAWSVPEGRALGRLVGIHSGPIFGVAFSPGGGLLASTGQDGYVRLFDIGARRELLALPGHNGYSYGVAFSPGGGQLASTGSDGVVRLWGGFSVAAAISRLCTYIDPRTAAQTWRELEPSVPYRRAC